MKNYVVSVVAVFSFLMLFGAVSTKAQSSGCVTAQIPFTFAALDREFTEGNYKICPANALHKLFSLEKGRGKAFVFINPRTVAPLDAQKPPMMVFKRYGNSYFLSEIRLSSVVMELARSKAEKELKRGIWSRPGGPTTVTISLSPVRGRTKS